MSDIKDLPAFNLVELFKCVGESISGRENKEESMHIGKYNIIIYIYIYYLDITSLQRRLGCLLGVL